MISLLGCPSNIAVVLESMQVNMKIGLYGSKNEADAERLLPKYPTIKMRIEIPLAMRFLAVNAAKNIEIIPNETTKGIR